MKNDGNVKTCLKLVALTPLAPWCLVHGPMASGPFPMVPGSLLVLALHSHTLTGWTTNIYTNVYFDSQRDYYFQDVWDI